MTDDSIDITELRPDYKEAMDLRGDPTSICPCGSEIWNLKTVFDLDGEIALYFRDMECARCGSLATAPIPKDAESDDATL